MSTYSPLSLKRVCMLYGNAAKDSPEEKALLDEISRRFDVDHEAAQLKLLLEQSETRTKFWVCEYQKEADANHYIRKALDIEPRYLDETLTARTVKQALDQVRAQERQRIVEAFREQGNKSVTQTQDDNTIADRIEKEEYVW